MYPELKLLLGGHSIVTRERDGEDVINPATGLVLGHLPHATPADLDEALAHAQKGFLVWRATSPFERANSMRRASDLIRERSDAIAKMMTLEQGKPLRESQGELVLSTDTLDWLADEGRRSYGRVIPSRVAHGRVMVLQEAIGPVAAFTPWNFPALTTLRKIGGALAAGCSIILKAAEETPATALAIADAFHDAGVPKDVLQLVYGVPHQVSRHLIASDVIRKVSFTGSVPVGISLAKLAAEGMEVLRRSSCPCRSSRARRSGASRTRAFDAKRHRQGMRMQPKIAVHDSREDAGTHLVAMRVEGIGKSFPGVQALENVGFDLRSGEVHALCGENGAGKSTLMKILAGSLQPDAGEIVFQGKPLALASPLDAKKQGVLLIHQELSLVPDLSVAENLYLGSLPMRRFGHVDHAALHRLTAAVLASAGIEVNSRAIVGELSIAKQQMVEIARALAYKCSVVIFDEPTASLTDAEAESLFAGIERLRRSGVAIAYISHKMKEIFRLSDRITVLRDGKVRGTLQTAATNEAEVTRLMIGRSLDHYFDRAARQSGREVLRIDGFVVPGTVRGESFAIRTGEVLGLYGLVGAGRSELVEAIFGLRTRTAGTLHLDGRPATIASSEDAVRLGLALVPEDRKRQGLVLGMSNRHNAALAVLRRTSRFGFTDGRTEEAIFVDYKQRLGIKAPSSATRTGTLSGGNQQKVVLAKWLATKPKVLILDEPTRGIDVGAKAEVHALVSRLAEQGLALIVISSEMPEIIGLSHRILTMQRGMITGEFDGETVREEDLVAAIMHQSLPEKQPIAFSWTQGADVWRN